MPIVSLFILCALFLEAMADEVQAGKLEENRSMTSFLAGTAAVAVSSAA